MRNSPRWEPKILLRGCCRQCPDHHRGRQQKAGAKELQQAGGISKFKPGFIFQEGGGLMAIYNDEPEIKEVAIDGHRLEITRNVCLVPGEYTLGLAGDYERLLDRLAIE